jgi:hypothetical protein
VLFCAIIDKEEYMTVELTPEEKVGIINSHLKNAAFNKYNLEVSLIQENAKTIQDDFAISKINTDLSETEMQITALNEELQKFLS